MTIQNGQPTRTWRNPRWATLTGPMADLRPIFQSLEQFLARPTFYNGVELGDGTPPTQDEEGVPVTPVLRDWSQTSIQILEDALAAVGTDLDEVYTTLAGMEEDLLALETDPISFTRITDVSIETPMLAANAVTAAKLAALNIGVGKWIASTSYSAGSDGWIIAADGTAEFNDVIVRGEVYAADGAVVLDEDGVKLEASSSGFAAEGAVKWMDGSDTKASLGRYTYDVTVGEGLVIRDDDKVVIQPSGTGGSAEGAIEVTTALVTVGKSLTVEDNLIVHGTTAVEDAQVYGNLGVTGTLTATGHPKIKTGLEIDTTTSSGFVTITHGLGTTPTYVNAVIDTDESDSLIEAAMHVSVDNVGSSTFRCKFINSADGTNINSQDVGVRWIAVA